MRPRAAACLLLGLTLAAAASGCGSTAASSGAGSAAEASALGGGSAAGTTGSAGGPALTGGSQVTGGQGSTGSSTGPAGGGSGSATSPGSGGGGAAGGGTQGATAPGGTATAPETGDGPGVSRTTINIAAAYDPDSAAADSALGAANANPGDTKAEDEALFRYINTHGGVAGRKLNPIWYKASVQNDTTTTDEQACQTWTKDAKTFLIAGGNQLTDQCTANAHGIAIGAGAIVLGTTQVERQFPMVVNLTGFSIDRAMGVTVSGLARQGYFSQGAKVGIATWDDNYYHYGIDHQALPALAALGVKAPQVAYIAVPQAYGDLGATSASVSNAVLKFAAAGIDHVLLFDGAAGINNSGVLVLEWMQQANSQHYYPRYGLNSTSGFNALASDYPQQELVNSVGLDWTPALSLTASDYAKYPLQPNGKLCLKIMDDAGQQQSGANAQAIQQAICETYFFLKQALDPVQGPLNQTTALAAINAMGRSYATSVTYGIDITSSQHSGATLVRNMAYQAGCQCFEQTSGSYAP